MLLRHPTLRFLFRPFSTSKQIIFTGVQPTGNLHIGNYLGSIRSIVDLQKPDRKLYLCIVDYHALTTRFQNQHSSLEYKGAVRADTLEMAETMLACGVDPEKTVLFVQSHVPEHTELCWILSCIAPQNWLNVMVQYKEKGNASSSLGLYSYPVLMAADIILYKASKVPVGSDQLQHLQLTQRYVDRFNSYFKDALIRPEYIPAAVPRVMSLTNGLKKMSKSEGTEKSRIHLTDNAEQIRNKIKKAKTDSINQIYPDQVKRPEVTNLLRLYSAFSQKSQEDTAKLYKDKTIMQFKSELGQLVANQLTEIQNNLKRIRSNPQYVKKILDNGAKQARTVASSHLHQIKQRIGLYQ